MRPHRVLLLGVFLAVDALVFDQLLKWIVAKKSLLLVGDFLFLHLRVAESINPHFAFSVPAPQWVVLCTVLLVLAGVSWRWWQEAREGLPSSLALACVIGAAASNVLDRFRLGGVHDWLEVGIRGWSVSSLNIADLCIIAGVIVWAWLSRQKT